ncbi:hypothetical protein HY090_00890 [Candidatus Kaiserbacteria bacterium]|nr:hypothetical protein [Candidatus Kaiserbacteria bacterium]
MEKLKRLVHVPEQVALLRAKANIFPPSLGVLNRRLKILDEKIFSNTEKADKIIFSPKYFNDHGKGKGNYSIRSEYMKDARVRKFFRRNRRLFRIHDLLKEARTVVEIRFANKERARKQREQRNYD